MKYIFAILATSVVLFSCTKTETKSPKLPVEITATDAFDSMNLHYNTFYRMAISIAHGAADSNSAVKFFSNDSVYEYHTMSDTLGLHLMDSTRYAIKKHYSVYQEPDPAFYTSTIGYVRTDYYPIGGSVNSFSLHDFVAIDTFVLSVGVGSENYVGTGAFYGRVKNGVPVVINFFR